MKTKTLFILFLLCAALLLTGACGSTAAGSGPENTAPASSGGYFSKPDPTATPEPTPDPKYTAETFTGIVTEAGLADLENYTNLKAADFTGSTCYEAIQDYAARHPEVAVTYTLALPGTEALSPTATEADITSSAALAALPAYAPYLSALDSISLSGFSFTAEDLDALLEAFPEAAVTYSVSILGVAYPQDTTELDLSSLSPEDVEAVAAELPKLKHLSSVQLMPETGDPALTIQDVAALAAGAPQAAFHYTFKFFGQTISTDAERVEYERANIGNAGIDQFYEILPAMTKLQYLLLDTCKVDDAVMAQFREDFADQCKIVWRVRFGPYSVLTDTTRILASVKGYCLTAYTCESLKYCNEVKYLDIGHNTIEDISFVQYMPDLEVAVVAINYWKDATPLASCTKLEYLEVFNTNLTDLTPLANLTNLKHLNISFLKNLSDITPLYGLTQLERLWIGCWNSIPDEQIEEIQRRLPNTEINTEVLAPTDGDWRKGERYELLQEQMGYNTGHNGQPEYSFH